MKFRLIQLVWLLPIMLMTAGVVAQAEAYKLSAGDQINIVVAGEPELSMAVKLDSTGIFRYPYLGRIKALEKTVAQLEEIIRSGLAGDYLLNPQVEVTMAQRRPFFINGEVSKKGAYPFEEGLTLRRALTIAGGLTDRADDTKITVIRENDPNRTERKVAMEDRIYPGDTVNVGTSFYFMDGEVKKRGQYPYRSGLTFRMAVTLAGGFTERADEDDIDVIRNEGKRSKKIEAKLDDLVKPRDVISIGQSFF